MFKLEFGLHIYLFSYTRIQNLRWLYKMLPRSLGKIVLFAINFAATVVIIGVTTCNLLVSNANFIPETLPP